MAEGYRAVAMRPAGQSSSTPWSTSSRWKSARCRGSAAHLARPQLALKAERRECAGGLADVPLRRVDAKRAVRHRGDPEILSGQEILHPYRNEGAQRDLLQPVFAVSHFRDAPAALARRAVDVDAVAATDTVPVLHGTARVAWQVRPYENAARAR